MSLHLADGTIVEKKRRQMPISIHGMLKFVYNVKIFKQDFFFLIKKREEKKKRKSTNYVYINK